MNHEELIEILEDKLDEICEKLDSGELSTLGEAALSREYSGLCDTLYTVKQIVEEYA